MTADAKVIEIAPDADVANPMMDIEIAPVADAFPPVDARPQWGCYDDAPTHDGKVKRAGVWYHGIKEGKGEAPPTLTDTWHCGPLHIEAMTANKEDGEHGRLLYYRSTTGHWKRWAMPMSMLAGDGVEVLKALMDEGLAVDLKAKNRILDYINAAIVQKRMRAATTTGWHGNAFVLPDEVIGTENIWFQATERTAPYGVAGSLDAWRELVAAPAIGNPLLVLGLSAAFAGVLLERLNVDGAGLHLFGDSSTGKTSILAASISVWGGQAFRRTWRVTSNGLEGAARMHTGTLLALDEVGECSPKDLYESAYALVNGNGKTRANVKGEARQVARWRVFVLSTGEVTITSRMAAGGFETKAGQSLRLLDVPVAGTYGAWNDLHGKATGAAFSDAVRDGAAANYGHAGPAFVRALIQAMNGDHDLSAMLGKALARIKAEGGQETRAARVFAICALAGELVTQAEIVPWPEGTALDAALHAFKLWHDHRGTEGRNAEDVAILRAVADFIDRHGDSRFSGLDDHDSNQTVRERAGYWKDTEAGRLYLFTGGGLREATKGCDMGRVIKALESSGAFAQKGANGKTAIATRTPDGGVKKLYHLDYSKLQGGANV